MNAAVGLMDGLGLDGDRCIRVIPRHTAHNGKQNLLLCRILNTVFTHVPGGWKRKRTTNCILFSTGYNAFCSPQTVRFFILGWLSILRFRKVINLNNPSQLEIVHFPLNYYLFIVTVVNHMPNFSEYSLAVVANISNWSICQEVPIRFIDTDWNPILWIYFGASRTLIGLSRKHTTYLFRLTDNWPLYFPFTYEEKLILPWVVCEHLVALLLQRYDVVSGALWPAPLLFQLVPRYSKMICGNNVTFSTFLKLVFSNLKAF